MKTFQTAKEANDKLETIGVGETVQVGNREFQLSYMGGGRKVLKAVGTGVETVTRIWEGFTRSGKTHSQVIATRNQ